MNSAPFALRIGYWDVAFASLMVGFGETYITAFALAMGYSERHSGLIATVPLLLGSLLQLFAPFGVRWLQSQRRWVVACAMLQSLALLALAALGILRYSFQLQLDTWVFAAASAYWCGAMSAAPSWNSWVTSIVPNGQHTHFFALRTRLSQLFTLLGLGVAGLCLQGLAEKEERVLMFSLLFAFAGCCRLISSRILQLHPEGPRLPKTQGFKRVLARSTWTWLRQRRTFILIVYMSATQFAVNISGPYFNAFMLKQLKFDYRHYMILISATFVARILAGGWFHKLAKSLGPTSLTHLGALLIIPSPALWLISNSFSFLIFAQLYSGFAWGCQELGVVLMQIEKQDPSERARLLTLTTLLNAAVTCLGSLIGFYLLSAVELRASDYHHIFVLSSCVRLLPFGLLFALSDSRIQNGAQRLLQRLSARL